MKAYHEQRKYTDDLCFNASPAAGFDFLAHWHDEIEIMVVLDGSQKTGINNQLLTLNKGTIALIAPWDIHYYVQAGPARTYMLIFPASLISGFKITQSYLWHIPPDFSQRIDSRLQQITHELEERSQGYELAAAGLLHLFLADLYRPEKNSVRMEVVSDGASGRNLMQQILSYLEHHFREPVSRNDLAAHFNLSVSHFSRLFRVSTGLTFTSYLARLRLERVCRALRQTDLTVTEIAYSCGFENIRSFNRIFRHHLDCSPSEIRSGGSTVI